MTGREPLERRLQRNAAFAAAVTGALVALAGCVFSTFIGHPPSPWVLTAAVVAGALASACAAGIVVVRTPRVRRALGLDERRTHARWRRPD